MCHSVRRQAAKAMSFTHQVGRGCTAAVSGDTETSASGEDSTLVLIHFPPTAEGRDRRGETAPTTQRSCIAIYSV
ncbi:hypothetical protein GCM10009587_02640 [Microbacterium maritypicum]